MLHDRGGGRVEGKPWYLENKGLHRHRLKMSKGLEETPVLKTCPELRNLAIFTFTFSLFLVLTFPKEPQ